MTRIFFFPMQTYICQPASFYRSSPIEHVGPFDDTLGYLMDYEFFPRASRRKVRFGMIPEALAASRSHGNCKTLSDGVHFWGEERRRVLAEYGRTKVQRRGALRLLGLIYRMKRYMYLLQRVGVDFANVRLARRLRQMV